MARQSSNPFILRVRALAFLSAEDEAALEGLMQSVTSLDNQQELMSDGELPEVVKVVLNGLACRYKILPDGRRQIVGFLLPGDLCDLQTQRGVPLDHSICTLAPSVVATVPWSDIDALVGRRPGVGAALDALALADVAILREWLVNIGRRDASERMAHLIWELYLRHAVVGRVQDNGFDLPLTQMEIADALGLSTVYVNKTVNRLRANGLVEMDRRRLRVLRLEELRTIAGFDPRYLQLPRAVLAQHDAPGPGSRSGSASAGGPRRAGTV